MCAYFFFLSFNLFNSRLLCFAIRWPLSSEHHSAPWWSRLSSLVTLDSTSADRGFSSLQFRFEGKWSTETFPVPLNWSTMGLILFFFKCHVLQILSYLKFFTICSEFLNIHIFSEQECTWASVTRVTWNSEALPKAVRLQLPSGQLNKLVHEKFCAQLLQQWTRIS